MRTNATLCCHLLEFKGLNETGFDVVNAIKYIAEDAEYNMTYPIRGAVMFTVAWDKNSTIKETGYGREKSFYLGRYNDLVNYIRDNKLGVVTKIPAATNPNHGSYVKVGIWSINKVAMKAWCRKEGLMQDDDDEWRIQ
ncbi:unnamed protein product [marine sediment metagenome]|uniref:Uncharacterized protein n=1 Tax=marine sediment metagenome TaxID=412755 RepID=X0VZV1_9ZZZZ